MGLLRFSLDVETRYYNDSGNQKNVFGMRKAELNQRIVGSTSFPQSEGGERRGRGLDADVMDIVNDPISFMDYLAEEDPKLFVSKKTGRGPLGGDWVRECSDAGRPVMCAYKLCKVEFKYWGMQTRIEKFIQDVGEFFSPAPSAPSAPSASSHDDEDGECSAAEDDAAGAPAGVGVAGRVARAHPRRHSRPRSRGPKSPRQSCE